MAKGKQSRVAGHGSPLSQVVQRARQQQQESRRQLRLDRYRSTGDERLLQSPVRKATAQAPQSREMSVLEGALEKVPNPGVRFLYTGFMPRSTRTKEKGWKACLKFLHKEQNGANHMNAFQLFTVVESYELGGRDKLLHWIEAEEVGSQTMVMQMDPSAEQVPVTRQTQSR